MKILSRTSLQCYQLWTVLPSCPFWHLVNMDQRYQVIYTFQCLSVSHFVQCPLVSHIVHGIHPLICGITRICPHVYIYDGDASHLPLAMTPGHTWSKHIVSILSIFNECRDAGSTPLGTSVVLKDQVFRNLNTHSSLTRFRVLRWPNIQGGYQVDKLAEVVLKNQWGLNLHLKKQRRLCSLWRTNFFMPASQEQSGTTSALWKNYLKT